MTRPRATIVVSALALLLFGMAFSLACLLADPYAHQPSGGWTVHLFGSLRRLVADHAYEEADRYFHHGVGHVEETDFSDPLWQLRRWLIPSAHAHLSEASVAEFLPWLRWTIRADPEHVEAWLVAAYWLQQNLRRPDLARAVYREAAQLNPKDYRVYLHWARLLLRLGEWGGAARLCERAWSCWPHPLDPKDEEAQLDRARLLEWRGYLHAWQGDLGAAIAALEEALALRPHHAMVRQELHHLRSAPPGESILSAGLIRLQKSNDDWGAPGHHTPPAAP